MSAQQTMTERTKYIETFEREYQTTLKLMKLYPADKLGLKPSPTSSEARQVLWTLALGQMVIGLVTEKDAISPEGMPQPPATLAEIIGTFEGAHRESMAKLEKFTDAQMNTTLKMPVAAKTMADVRRGDALWMFQYDNIHHRGQLTVYQRAAGGKVPSIYGPSGDEPWY